MAVIGFGLALVVIFAGWPERRGRMRRERPRAARTGVRRRLDDVVLVGGSGMLAGAVVGSPLLAVVAPLTAVAWWRERRRRRRRRQADDRRAAIVGFVDRITEGLRAGRPLGEAVSGACRGSGGEPARHPGLARVAGGLDAGRGLAAALDIGLGGGDGVGDDERLVATTLAALIRSGGVATPSVERVADTLRERADGQEDLRTQAQQAQSSATVMAVLPMVFATGVALADSAVAHFYRSTWLGAGCGALAIVSTLLGWEWQQRLIWGRT